ncbi:MAG: hypothetical protein PVI78_04920 [Anaerolineales bacterium]
MKLSLQESELSEYVAKQLSCFFPDGEFSGDQLFPFVQTALERVEHCFSRISNKWYFDGVQTVFNHLHTDQYAMFLYFLGNSIHRANGDYDLAIKTYALNKALHSIDVFFEVELPEVFFFQHPMGTVLGRAEYSNFFVVYQRCTVGGNPELEYPSLGEGVIMYGGSAIIGNCAVGDNCWLSIDAIVIDQDLPSNSVVFGKTPDIVIKSSNRNATELLFREA